MPKRAIFREKALTAYRRGMDKDVLPRLVSWPVIACSWFLLGVFMAAGFLAWSLPVPIYVSGPGIILPSGSADGETEAVLFFPPDESTHLRAGFPVNIQVGPGDLYVRSTVSEVETGPVSPDTARKSYQLDGAGALLITQPSSIVVVRLGPALPASAYAGSIVTAEVEIGSQRLLSLIPGLEKFFGGGL